MAISSDAPVKSLSKLTAYLKPLQTWLFISAIAAACVAAAEFISVLLLERLTDAALGRDTALFRTYLFIGLAALIIDLLSTYGKGMAAAVLSSRMLESLRNETVKKIQQLPFSYTDERSSGDLLSRLNKDMSTIGDMIKRVPDFVYQPLLFVSGFSYMLVLSWKLLLATCILIPLSAVLFNRFTKPMQELSRRKLELLGDANGAAQDAIQGIEIVKAFNLQNVLAEKYNRIIDDVEAKSLSLDKRNSIMIGLFLALRYIPQLVCPLYGGYLAFQGEITVGSLLACNLLIWMVFRPVEEMLAWFKQAREASPAVERVFDILDHPGENHPDCREFIPCSTPHTIEFKDVTMGYNGNGAVLKQLNFRLEAGQQAALVGSSGSGKSTVLRLICGLYRPEGGKVILLGNDLFASNLTQARRSLALVTQSPYLFPVSIAENIAYGRPEASQADIVHAARLANAHDFITSLPDGYDTQVGEWGNRMSGGQRQRLALARAFLKDAPVVLLDEPTSALDSESEAAVQEAIQRLTEGRSVLVVAHRLSSLKHVDTIFVLEHGSIVEQGTHAELMQSDTLYRRLYEKQIEHPQPTPRIPKEASA